MKELDSVKLVKDYCIILHIPHSERNIPQKYRDLFYDTDKGLEYEINFMVDSFTDELFVKSKRCKIDSDAS